MPCRPLKTGPTHSSCPTHPPHTLVSAQGPLWPKTLDQASPLPIFQFTGNMHGALITLLRFLPQTFTVLIYLSGHSDVKHTHKVVQPSSASKSRNAHFPKLARCPLHNNSLLPVPAPATTFCAVSPSLWPLQVLTDMEAHSHCDSESDTFLWALCLQGSSVFASVHFLSFKGGMIFSSEVGAHSAY